MLVRSDGHRGTSFLEIYQNCNIFNDGAFEVFTEKDTKPGNTLFLEHGKPLVFGSAQDKGIRLDGFKPVVVDLASGKYTLGDLWVHDEQDLIKAQILSRFFDDPSKISQALPRPFGVFYETSRACYESMLAVQLEEATSKLGEGKLDALLAGSNTWEIK
jgi:2-oxoglutarate ferredoxin oxidoreductase subunit beta